MTTTTRRVMMALPAPDPSLADLFEPLGLETFWQEVYGRTWHAFLQKPLHLQRFEKEFSFTGIMRLLQLPAAWTPQNLKLVVDGNTLPPKHYCQYSNASAGNWTLDWDRVQRTITSGATLVANAVDLWHEGANRLAAALEMETLCRVQVNLYWTHGSRRGFDLHYDAHDVLVLQIKGRKAWKIYQGQTRYPDQPVPPISDARSQATEFFDSVDLQAGDVLYVPAGRYHEAVVRDEDSVHLSFALKLLRPKDIMSVMFSTIAENNWVDEVLYLRPYPEAAIENSLIRIKDEVTRLTTGQELVKRTLWQARNAARVRQGLKWEV